VDFLLGRVQKGEPDCGCQQVEEFLFLFLLLAAERLAGTTASGTQFKEFSASTAQTMHAGIAHHFTAFSALISDTGSRVARTNQGAIGQYYGRGGSFRRELILRDLNLDVGVLDQQFDIPNREVLSREQFGLLDGFSFHKSPVSGIAVTQEEDAISQLDFAMKGGDGGVFNSKIIIRTAAEAIDPEPELNHLVLNPICFDNQSCHVR
jgi:hypothetical protein